MAFNKSTSNQNRLIKFMLPWHTLTSIYFAYREIYFKQKFETTSSLMKIIRCFVLKILIIYSLRYGAETFVEKYANHFSKY